jgi:hypothetical protein
VAERRRQAVVIGAAAIDCHAYPVRAAHNRFTPFACLAVFSDAQCQQLNEAETDYQYDESHGIVIEPMLSKHRVHPCLNARFLLAFDSRRTRKIRL